MSVPSRAYRRLAAATVVATFLLIVVGGIVRVSNAGLGCGPAGSGIHGWPLCQGDLVPGVNLSAAIEYTHRVLASGVVVLILILLGVAVRSYRSHPRLVRAAAAALGLVILQALLGAVTVENDLAPVFVAAHLGLGMILLAATAYIWYYAATATRAPRGPRPDRLRWLVTATQFATFAAIVAGGLMAGTEHRGRPDEHLTSGAHYACGTHFPACNGGFLPFGQANLVDIHLTHRVFVYLTTILVVWVAVAVWRRRPPARLRQAAALLLVLLVCQLVLGTLNVLIPREYAALIAAHLTVATLLWASLLGLGLIIDRTESQAEPPSSPAEAVPA